jgi:hypothetical protein
MKKSLLITTVVMMAGIATTNAQIIYTDVSPDVNYTGSGDYTYNLDLNNDASIDFVLFSDINNVSGTLYEQLSITPTAGNSVNSYDAGGVKYTICNASGIEIDGDLDFFIVQSVMIYRINQSAQTNSPWTNATDRYLALRFNIGSNIHYGWARLTSTGFSWTLKDYAYESTPAGPINTGEMPSTASISENESINFELYPNPAQESVTLNNLTIGSTLRLIDLTGKTILERAVSSTTLDLDLNLVKNGIYLVQLVQNGAIAQKKLVVNK